MGFSLDAFTLVHVAISLVALASGLVVAGGWLANVHLSVATHLFLWTTVLTNVTGLMFPFNGLLPSHGVAIISLALLAVALFAYYGRSAVGVWRAVYLVTATAALYLNAFVLVVQTFLKNPALAALAPTQSEAPFVVAQAAMLAAFAALGWMAVRRLRSEA